MEEAIKILCVDDEPNVLNALKRFFLDEDYIILTASSAEEGLQTLEREDVQVVISDYRMPGMNGVEFLKKVCERRPHTVRLVLSGYADTASIVAAINEGQIYKFIPKPWNDDELKVTVLNAIERYALYKKNRELASELQAKNEELTRVNAELNRLLVERTDRLEISSKGLITHQKLIDALPVGVMGIDFNNVIAFCNLTWVNSFGHGWHVLGRDVNNALPKEVIDFIDEIKSRQRGEKLLTNGDVQGRLVGAVMDGEGEQHGIIIVFVPGVKD